MIVEDNFEKKEVHRTRIVVRWGDMDAMGHVNNTVYFRYLEQARVEWLETMGLPPEPMGSGPVVINAHCTFIRQLKYPATIEVRTLVGPPGRSSFQAVQEIREIGADGAPEEELTSLGGAKIVWVDSNIGKSVPLPDLLRSLLPAA
jgi:acyl-CoA thioester hydrolase